MHRIIFSLLALVLAAPAWAQSIKVSAAISLKQSLLKIAADYERATGQKVEFNFGASGQLATQIRQGAPVDLFISAANAQVDDLSKAGLLVDETRRVVARNRLVLVVPKSAPDIAGGVAALADPRFKHIAIGQVKTVPAGQYAMQALTAAKLADALNDRLVFGANVRQVLEYVARNEVDAGFVYATDAAEAADRVRVAAVIDSATHDPIEYPAAIVKASAQRQAAEQFEQYLLTDAARAILSASGFLVQPATRPTTQTGS